MNLITQFLHQVIRIMKEGTHYISTTVVQPCVLALHSFHMDEDNAFNGVCLKNANNRTAERCKSLLRPLQ
jgi:hypothetical protein